MHTTVGQYHWDHSHNLRNPSFKHSPDFAPEPLSSISGLLADARGVAKMPFDAKWFLPIIIDSVHRNGNEDSLSRLGSFLRRLWRSSEACPIPVAMSRHYTPTSEIRPKAPVQFGTDSLFTRAGYSGPSPEIPTANFILSDWGISSVPDSSSTSPKFCE